MSGSAPRLPWRLAAPALLAACCLTCSAAALAADPGGVNAYGPIAFGTSAQSQTLTDWPAGGFVAIHGTNEPGLIPGRPSHGCIRLRNPDLVRLARPLPIGTPLEIR
jgi:lipoprotein-anchoring transpeptidase ErfK/SrfK